MKHHLVDRYYHLDSLIHRLDPRAKLLGIFILVFSIVLVKDLLACILALTISLIFLYLSKLPLKFAFEQLKYGLIFLLILSITMLIFGHRPFEIFTRATSALILIFVAFATSRFDISIKALNQIGFPSKLTQILMFAYRYIFVFAEEYEKLSIALKMKGFEKRTNIHTFETIAKLIATLFIRSYERAESVYRAMILRGYTGNIETITDFKITARDILFVTLSLYLAITLHIVAWML
ncbi:energy-coupling factor transporter transmembrane component T family protein [Archaeoglobus profundus]|uniref:Cobalt ABC transporter, inner membrane subunit CbiQ n=1 Tax=Archaeoglobus profundus (strain DSM 5631 / JCM 9629 / NBRC 100127 / Av18) TaxID=572546 RepID=D2RGQ9_ARCPA|nr:energy-coupling factor transporter transmembrane component T [Archaeoglobus profundus]ADB57484.1 cobalt ABC transporter, inner membrane subunit CbiQ [Archaeoglobus profundus DSM 5631]